MMQMSMSCMLYFDEKKHTYTVLSCCFITWKKWWKQSENLFFCKGASVKHRHVSCFSLVLCKSHTHSELDTKQASEGIRMQVVKISSPICTGKKQKLGTIAYRILLSPRFISFLKLSTERPNFKRVTNFKKIPYFIYKRSVNAVTGFIVISHFDKECSRLIGFLYTGFITSYWYAHNISSVSHPILNMLIKYMNSMQSL